MADGENMADSFVSQQIMKVTSRDPGLLDRMGPDSRGTGSPTLVRMGEDSGGHCSKTGPITLRSPAAGEALRGVNAAGQGFGLTAWTVKISDKAESKGQDCPKLVTQTRTDPKNKMHELTLYLAEQGGQRVEQRKCSLRPESRGTGKCIITRRSQKQTLVLVNMFRQKRYGSKSLLPKADGALSLFLLSLLSFLPCFLSICFWLVV